MRTSVTILVLAVAAAVTGLAYGVGTSAGSSEASGKTLHFVLREEFIPLDEGAKGPSDHERVLLRGTLLDPGSKAPRGTELGTCIAADTARQNRLVCQVVFTPSATRDLAGADQITAQVVFDDVQTSKPQRTAITGGTGRYIGAGGEIVARPGPGGLIDVVFRFTR